MLPYLTDYENDRRLFRPRVVNAIIVELPFLILYKATIVWFDDAFLLSWMQRNHYCYIWFVLCLISAYRPKFAIATSYGNAAAIILAQILGDLILGNNTIRATPEDYLVPCHGNLSHHGISIWIDLFFTVIVLYVAYARQIEPRIKARRERRGK